MDRESTDNLEMIQKMEQLLFAIGMWLILGPAAWVSWISPGLLRSICGSSGLLRGSPGFLRACCAAFAYMLLCLLVLG